jgi:hypothetical protein
MVGVILLLIVSSIIPISLSHDQAIAYSPYNYFFAQILLFLIAASLKRVVRNRFLLSPSFIAASYLNINFLIGSLVFMHGSVYESLLTRYVDWKSLPLSMTYFNLANFSIIGAYFLSRNLKLPNSKLLFDARRVKNLTLIFVGIFLVILFSFVGINLSFFSSDQSDFYIIPKSLGAILIVAILYRSVTLKIRIICYSLIILVFSISSFEDKRDAIFLLLPILLLESRKSNFRVDLKKGLTGILAISFLSYLIMVMSILRGYGSYNPSGFIDAMKYVPDYIRSEDFIPAFMNNLEISYTYFHSNNAIEQIVNDPKKITFGSTIIKPLFIFIPREYFPQKPVSIIEHYTNSFSKEMRSEGFSAPISIQSEMFWNFHFLGVIFLFFLFILFNSVYRNVVQLIEADNIINYLPLLYIYQQSLVLFRGSGLDQFLVDVVLSFLIYSVVKIIIRILLPVRSESHQH